MALQLISDFTGSDENPLSEGGNWAAVDSVGGTVLQRISNAAAGVSASQCTSYWTPANFGPDLDAYVTLSTFASLQGIAVRIQGEGGAGTWDGYLIKAQASSFVLIIRVTNGANTNLTNPSKGSNWASGDKLGVRIAGSRILVWWQASGSSTWNLITAFTDTTYASAGKVALVQSGTTGRLDDFFVDPDSDAFDRPFQVPAVPFM